MTISDHFPESKKYFDKGIQHVGNSNEEKAIRCFTHAGISIFTECDVLQGEIDFDSREFIIRVADYSNNYEEGIQSYRKGFYEDALERFDILVRDEDTPDKVRLLYYKSAEKAYFLQYCHKTERYGFRQGFLNREYYDPYDFVDVKGIEKGMCIVREAETGWGVIDRNHYTILKFEFDTVIENHSHNLFLVQKAGLFGFYNNHGYQMISCQYEEAEPFSEGFAPVMYKGKWGFIDVLDNFVIEPVYEKVEDFSEGKVFVIPFGEKATGGFFIDKKGQQVSEKYHSGSSFRNGMAAVFNGKKWGYLNTDFKVAIDFQYDDAFGFDTYPFTAVRIEDNWQYINRRGIRIFDANNDFKFVK